MIGGVALLRRRPIVERLLARGDVQQLAGRLAFGAPDEGPEAARALLQIGTPEALDQLVLSLVAPDANIRPVVKEALESVTDPASIDHLKRCVADGPPSAPDYLRTTPELIDRPRAALLEILLPRAGADVAWLGRLVRSRSDEIRERAADALVERGGADAAQAVLEAGALEPDRWYVELIARFHPSAIDAIPADTRAALTEALGKVILTKAHGPVISAWSRSTSSPVEAAAGLLRVLDANALRELSEGIRTGAVEAHDRAGVAEVLLGEEEARRVAAEEHTRLADADAARLEVLQRQRDLPSLVAAVAGEDRAAGQQAARVLLERWKLGERAAGDALLSVPITALEANGWMQAGSIVEAESFEAQKRLGEGTGAGCAICGETRHVYGNRSIAGAVLGRLIALGYDPYLTGRARVAVWGPGASHPERAASWDLCSTCVLDVAKFVAVVERQTTATETEAVTTGAASVSQEHYELRCRDCDFAHPIPTALRGETVEFSVDEGAVRLSAVYGGRFTVTLTVGSFFTIVKQPSAGLSLEASIGGHMPALHQHLMTHHDPLFLLIRQTEGRTDHEFASEPAGPAYVRYSRADGTDVVGPIDIAKAEIPGL